MRSVAKLAEAAVRQLWMRQCGQEFSDRGPARKPRLLIDISMILRRDAGTGIQRVVRAVWSHLNSLADQRFDVIPVYAGRTHGYCFAPRDFLKCERSLRRTPVGVRPGDHFLGLDLSAHFLPTCREQLSAWRANGASVHVVVYDLLPLSRPDWFERGTTAHFTAWFETLKQQADQLFCISDTVARETGSLLIDTPPATRPKVSRMYLSGDIESSIPSRGLSTDVVRALRTARERATILMVGTVEPRKGYDRALSAFEYLWSMSDRAPTLVIIGSAGWKTAALQERIRCHAENGGRLYWLEEVSDEALAQFYTLCRGVFIASHAEGFGLPVAEAAMHRRWTLVRDLPVFREQQLPNVRYFHDDSAMPLASEISKLLELADRTPPPEPELPSWSWCVERLVDDLRGPTTAQVGRRPMMVAG